LYGIDNRSSWSIVGLQYCNHKLTIKHRLQEAHEMSNTGTHRSRYDLPAPEQPITIRDAVPADRGELRRLAELDSALLPTGPMVVGEVDGEVRAAYSVDERRAIANPFKRTAELVALVELHARQANRARNRRRRRSVAPQPPGFGIGLVPPHPGRRAA
jgi:hypothetical protein